MELLKVIAMFCAISAGDSPEIGTMEKRISYEQAKCHRYYAKCMAEKNRRLYPVNGMLLCAKNRVQVKKKRKVNVKKKTK